MNIHKIFYEYSLNLLKNIVDLNNIYSEKEEFLVIWLELNILAGVTG